MEREKKIKSEYSKLKKLYSDIPKNKMKLLDNLLQNAAFMAVTLEELQEKINKDGAIIEMVNGNGFKTKTEHPAQKSYNTMINRYNTTMGKLVELLPAEREKSKLEAMMDE